jgi:hypothetical protein
MLNDPWWTPTTHCADDLYICKILPVTWIAQSVKWLGYRLHDWGIGFWWPAGERVSPLLSGDQTNPVAHPAFCSQWKSGSPPQQESRQGAKFTTHIHLVQRLTSVELYLQSNTSLQGVGLNHTLGHYYFSSLAICVSKRLCVSVCVYLTPSPIAKNVQSEWKMQGQTYRSASTQQYTKRIWYEHTPSEAWFLSYRLPTIK